MQFSRCARATCPLFSNTGRSSAVWSIEKMLALPDRLYGQGIGSNYQAQSLKLSKHFRG